MLKIARALSLFLECTYERPDVTREELENDFTPILLHDCSLRTSFLQLSSCKTIYSEVSKDLNV